jgi:hypothetical protein
LRFNGKSFTGCFKNYKIQLGDTIVQQGGDSVITKLKGKQDGAIVTTFHNREMFGVYICEILCFCGVGLKITAATLFAWYEERCQMVQKLIKRLLDVNVPKSCAVCGVTTTT